MKITATITLKKQHINTHDFDVIDKVFDPEIMPPAYLLLYSGALCAIIEAGDDARFNPFVVPRLRSYFHALSQRWQPGVAAHFCDLGSALFQLYAAGSMSRAVVVERDVEQDYAIRADAKEIASFAQKALSGIHQYGKRAGLPRVAIAHRQRHLTQSLKTIFCGSRPA